MFISYISLAIPSLSYFFKSTFKTAIKINIIRIYLYCLPVRCLYKEVGIHKQY